jgi:hypothetical protein
MAPSLSTQKRRRKQGEPCYEDVTYISREDDEGGAPECEIRGHDPMDYDLVDVTEAVSQIVPRDDLDAEILASRGREDDELAKQHGVHPSTVARRRKRFHEEYLKITEN